MKRFLPPALLALTTILAACGPSAPPSTTPAASSPTAAPGALVTPYYEFSSQGDWRVVSGSQQVDDAVTTDGRLYLQHIQSGETRALTPTATFGDAFFAEGGELSPDGRTVYTFVLNADGWTLQGIDVASGQATALVNNAQGPFKPEGKTLTVSPDGTRLAFRGYDLVTEQGSVRPVHAVYDMRLDRSKASAAALTKTAIQSETMTSPSFDRAGQLGRTALPPFKYLGASLNAQSLSAQYLGVLGRLPYAGNGTLTQSFHGSGGMSGSWGRGLDLVPATTGAAVRAIAAGTVNYARFEAAGCGNYVSIDHTTTTYDAFYCHMNSTASGVATGTVVQEGTVLGVFGGTGNVTGPHIRLAIIANDTFGLRGRVGSALGDCQISATEWVVNQQYGYFKDATNAC